MNQVTTCPACHFSILTDYYYCPNCGIQIKQKPIHVSAIQQIGIYLFSFFLSPLGLYFAFKYLKQPDPKIKLIGWVVIALTILAISITIFYATQFFEQYTTMLNQFSNTSSF